MIIKEVNITSFGKLQNKKYTFADGINVIYGENEAGKTTLQQFIKAMLFGLEKKRGRVAGVDEYAKYEPWDAPAYFSGSLIFETGGQKFLLERNLYHKEATVRLVNLGDLEELSVEKGDLDMLLGNISKSAYENTYCISQEKLLPQAELGTMLADERANLAQTKDASFQLSNALERLTQKKKTFEKQKKEFENARLTQIEQLRSKQQLLQEQSSQMSDKIKVQLEKEALAKNQMQALKSQEQKAKAELEADQIPAKTSDGVSHKNDRKKQWNPLVILGVAGAILMQILLTTTPDYLIIFRIIQVICVILVIIGIVMTMRKNEVAEQELRQEQEDVRAQKSMKLREVQQAQQDCYLTYRTAQTARETMEQELQEQSLLFENNHQQMAELSQPGTDERGLEHEIQSITLATDTLQRLAKDLADETDDLINQRMSQIISAITTGKYDDLKLEANKQLYLTDNYRKRKPENYSQATMQQMYFAYRMAAGEMLAKEETLPFLLDESFASYDENRLREVLRWLSCQEQQLLLFTCRRLETEVLRELGCSFYEINL